MSDGQPTNKVGAKTKYDPETTPLKAKELAFRGLSNEEMAKALNISEGTFYNWRKEHLKFLKAIDEGRIKDNEEIEASYSKRAKGYTTSETKTTYKYKLIPATGEEPEKELCVGKKIEIQERHIPGDTRAMEGILYNRLPERWKRKVEVEHSGAVQLLPVIHDTFDENEGDRTDGGESSG